MGGELPYKWEAYCRVSLSSKLKSQENMAIQMGGVLPYKLEVYCVLFRQVVGVGVSETLPIEHIPDKLPHLLSRDSRQNL